MAVMEGMIEVRETRRDTAEYVERVMVRTREGVQFSGSQRYGVRQSAEGFVLCFAETGVIFQDVRFREDGEGRLRGETVHDCGMDRYASVYRLGPGRVFSVRHAVNGPRKEYVSTTRFEVL